MKKIIGKIGEYFSSVGAEDRKVSWPDRRELIDSSVVVIVFITILAVTTLVYDFGIRKMIDAAVPDASTAAPSSEAAQ